MGLITRNPDFIAYKNKGADQHAYPRILTNVIGIRLF